MLKIVLAVIFVGLFFMEMSSLGAIRDTTDPFVAVYSATYAICMGIGQIVVTIMFLGREKVEEF